MRTRTKSLIDSARVDRGAWKLYVGAAIIFVGSALMAYGDAWGAAALGLVLAGWVALHPSLRRDWYCIGFLDGYNDAVTDATRTP